jgi:hypothetical protein
MVSRWIKGVVGAITAIGGWLVYAVDNWSRLEFVRDKAEAAWHSESWPTWTASTRTVIEAVISSPWCTPALTIVGLGLVVWALLQTRSPPQIEREPQRIVPIDWVALDRLEYLMAECDWSLFAVSPSGYEQLTYAVSELEQFLAHNGSRFDYDTMALAVIFCRAIRSGFVEADVAGTDRVDFAAIRRGFSSAEKARSDLVRRLREVRAVRRRQ